jgi:hypothetical protein
MKCLECPLKCTGQTGRRFSVRYKEHIQAIGNNINNSGYSDNILNTGHTYITIPYTMDIMLNFVYMNIPCTLLLFLCLEAAKNVAE